MHNFLIDLLQAIYVILCSLQYIRRVFFGIPGDDYLQSFFDYLHVDVFSHHHRVPVKVHYSRFGTVDAQRLAAESLDAAILVYSLIKQLERQGGHIQHRERFKDGHVQ